MKKVIGRTQREWLADVVHTLRVKICGITNLADQDAAVRAGADLIGYNFYPRSPRYLSFEAAFSLVESLPAETEPVAVCVEEAPAALLQRLQPAPRRMTIQWHGADPPLPARLHGRHFVAFALRQREDLSRLQAYLGRCKAQDCLPAALLVDAHAPGLYGGTGRTAPWELLTHFQPEIPFYLAGGLTPDNVAEAIRQVRPDGIDVAGGVEAAPGRKDADKMRRFIDRAREAAAGLG